jgi:hypothetical protein
MHHNTNNSHWQQQVTPDPQRQPVLIVGKDMNSEDYDIMARVEEEANLLPTPPAQYGPGAASRSHSVSDSDSSAADNSSRRETAGPAIRPWKKASSVEFWHTVVQMERFLGDGGTEKRQ